MEQKRAFRQVAATAGLILTLFCSGVHAAAAQTGATATGDARTVTEPVIPASCTVLSAQLTTTGMEPSSETALDTTRIQSALTACPAGQAVELATNGSLNAFLTGPITLPTGVTLLVDGGVTMFGSRNPADYQVTGSSETCGTVGTNGVSCNALITSTKANSSIMGFGLIDGRGGDKLLVNGTASTSSWWDIAGQAQNSGGAQNNPILLSANAANFTLYKITFRNSPMFHVKWAGNTTNRTGFTAWGVKIITPFTARNTDGIDPSGQNISVLNSSISDGDDNVAVSASSAAANITVSNVNTYSGHGISVGSITQGGLNNMLVQNINQMGTAQDGNGIGLRIKATQTNGGLVQNVTYQNICAANNRVAIYLSPFYTNSSGSLTPTFTNIIFRNIHELTANTVNLQGSNATHVSTVTLDNVIFDNLSQSNLNPTPAYVAITYGPGPVTPLLTTQNGTGDSSTPAPNPNSNAPYPCAVSNFQYLVGELFGSNGASTNLKTIALPAGSPVTLNAMLQPAMSQVSYASMSGGGSYTGTPAPTAAVTFKEGSTVVGTGTLGGNGTLATVTLTGVTPGIHTYTGYYAGDATYTNPLAFGSVTVTIGGTTTTLSPSSTTSTYGQSTTLTATVTGAGTPGGMVQFFDGATSLGTVTLSSGSAQLVVNLNAGTRSLTAMYLGDANDATSTSVAVPVTVAPAVLTVTASNASRIFSGINPAFNVTITGFVNGDSNTSGAVTGMAALSVAATRASNAGMYQITPTQGTLAAANYTFSFAAGVLTITGGAAQSITFPPLASEPVLTAISLLGTASSGLNVSYAVTSGNATLSGNVLTVQGLGTVTVQATQAGNANFAAAPPVSISFAAQ